MSGKRQGRYARLAGTAWRHRVLGTLSPEAFSLWARCLSYCPDELTDGVIPSRMLRAIAGSTTSPKALRQGLDECLERGVIILRADGDYELVHYLEHNVSRADDEARLERERIRDRARDRSGRQTRTGTGTDLEPGRDPERSPRGDHAGTGTGTRWEPTGPPLDPQAVPLDSGLRTQDLRSLGGYQDLEPGHAREGGAPPVLSFSEPKPEPGPEPSPKPVAAPQPAQVPASVRRRPRAEPEPAKPAAAAPDPRIVAAEAALLEAYGAEFEQRFAKRWVLDEASGDAIAARTIARWCATNADRWDPAESARAIVAGAFGERRLLGRRVPLGWVAEKPEVYRELGGKALAERAIDPPLGGGECAAEVLTEVARNSEREFQRWVAAGKPEKWGAS